MNTPLAWISMPTCVVAELAERTLQPPEHLLYRRIYQAYGRPWTSPPSVGPAPDAWPQAAEDLAAGAVNPLLASHGREDVEIFIDCRSGAMTSGPAPTYRLAMLADVTTATPVCIWGQEGPEVAFAVSVLIRRLSARGKAVLSACQCIVSPDTRAPAWTNLTLGDAAAAVLISKRRFAGSLPVLAVKTGNTDRTDLLARALRAAGLSEEPRWTLVADPSQAETECHSRWPNIYFGVADILVKLAKRSTPTRAGVGALVMHGRAGTSAVMLLGTEKPDVT